MELKNANPNIGNVIVKSTYPMILFFPKNIENWVR